MIYCANVIKISNPQTRPEILTNKKKETGRDINETYFLFQIPISRDKTALLVVIVILLLILRRKRKS
ncbi:hypothetical protein D7D25_05860 [Proteiniphilum sp. X52]|nr:hypothetical protein D7D25_05860 [Proteiniphilum sp. X52]